MKKKVYYPKVPDVVVCNPVLGSEVIMFYLLGLKFLSTRRKGCSLSFTKMNLTVSWSVLRGAIHCKVDLRLLLLDRSLLLTIKLVKVVMHGPSVT